MPTTDTKTTQAETQTENKVNPATQAAIAWTVACFAGYAKVLSDILAIASERKDKLGRNVDLNDIFATIGDAVSKMNNPDCKRTDMVVNVKQVRETLANQHKIELSQDAAMLLMQNGDTMHKIAAKKIKTGTAFNTGLTK